MVSPVVKNPRQVNATERVFNNFQNIPVQVFSLVGLAPVLIHNGQIVHGECVIGVLPECKFVLFNGFSHFLVIVMLNALVEMTVNRGRDISATKKKRCHNNP